MSALHPLARYRSLVGDWAAFEAACNRLQPVTFWPHPGRISGEALRGRLAGYGLEPAPLPWLDGVWELPAGTQLSGRWEFFAGLYLPQGAASVLPVRLLAPCPGERVLDLCAAPGGKTALLALAVGDTGTVIANDFNRRRLKHLRQTCERLGLLNVAITHADGTSLPRSSGRFDRVLVDAPCSCEGTCRKYPAILADCGPEVSAGMAGPQRAMLRKAIQLCRAGGRIVYCTCTFAPEENELVVADALASMDGQVRLLPARLPGVEISPGVTEWDGQALPDELALTGRLWPHAHDTGGFFVAVLEKLTDTPDIEPVPEIGDGGEPRALVGDVAERFGIAPEVFAPWHYLRQDNELYVASPHLRLAKQPLTWQTGMLFGRQMTEVAKWSVPAALRFGRHATRSIVPLTQEQAQGYLDRDVFRVEAEQVAGVTPGYVILAHDAIPLGMGLLLAPEADKPWRIRSLFPRRWLKTRRG